MKRETVSTSDNGLEKDQVAGCNRGRDRETRWYQPRATNKRSKEDDGKKDGDTKSRRAVREASLAETWELTPSTQQGSGGTGRGAN